MFAFVCVVRYSGCNSVVVLCFKVLFLWFVVNVNGLISCWGYVCSLVLCSLDVGFVLDLLRVLWLGGCGLGACMVWCGLWAVFATCWFAVCFGYFGLRYGYLLA